jgi:hypothetical protein
MRYASVVLGKDGRGGLEEAGKLHMNTQLGEVWRVLIIVVLSSSHECRLYSIVNIY